MSALQPTGTVTMVFTDIEGSTSLLRRLGPERYAEAVEMHRRLIRAACHRHNGFEVDCEGDAFFLAFSRAADAIAAAAEAQQALASAESEGESIHVRMGIHTGEPLAVAPKYVGIDVHKAARIMAAGHGGQVLLSAATQRLINEEAETVSLGEHRLKDLMQAEPLYQLRIDGLPSQFPALKTLGNKPTNLPVLATTFIGRERELADVQSLRMRATVRLLTLTGPGGIGKTRLALQAAADAVDQFRDGVYWVPFASVRDPALVGTTVAQALSLREETGEPASVVLGRYLGDKQLLLVLDNLEHLISSARDLAAHILRAAPGIEIIATTREALRIGGEQLYEVPSLAIPHGVGRALHENEAVQLFVDRSQAADPTFVLDDANAATVADIVGRLEGLPLALELAAARVRTLPPGALLERLDDRLRVLTSGAHDADNRQRTLRATIQWSYDLLTPPEQTLLDGLAVFVGGCRLGAAEAVCDRDGTLAIGVLDGIGSLLDKSLLRRRDDPDGQPRYWMLEAIREYAVAALHVNARKQAVVARHAEYFFGQAVAAEGTPEKVDPNSYARLAADLPNVRAALEVFAAVDPARLCPFVAALGEFFEFQGHLAEGERWLRLALARCPAVCGDHVKIRTGLAKLALRRGELAVAVDEADAAVVAGRLVDDRCCLANALRARAIPAVFTEDFATARQLYDEAVQLLAEERADALLAVTTVDLTDLSLNQHEWEEAAAIARRGIQVGRDSHPVAEAVSYLNLGIALLELSRNAEAIEALRNAIRLTSDLSLHLFLGSALVRLAALLADSDPSRAARLFGAGQQLQHELSAIPDPIEHEAADRTRKCLQASLTSDGFELQRKDGSHLDSEAAVELALSATE